jgi:hypothetical protein
MMVVVEGAAAQSAVAVAVVAVARLLVGVGEVYRWPATRAPAYLVAVGSALPWVTRGSEELGTFRSASAELSLAAEQ